jgi:hypothetical protein
MIGTENHSTATMQRWTRPYYPPAFPLGPGYEFGLEAAREIARDMIGGPGCSEYDSALLAEMVYRAGHADHLELGTFYGTTAILVAMVKKQFDFDGEVFCIDNFSYRPSFAPRASPDLVLENASKFGVEKRITILEGNTYPLPPDIVEKYWGSSYIDAAHDFASCQRDWLSVKDISNAVAFHDYDIRHMGVVSALRNAMQEPGWWLVHLSHHTGIMERIE